VKVEAEPVVSAFMKSIEKNKDYLSTSVGVIVGFPPLIISLTDKEKDDPTRPLSGDEKVGLDSIIGWDQSGTTMSGTAAFLLHQKISVLYSEHVPSTSQPIPSSSHLMSSHSDPSISGFSTCGRPQWITYHYYSRSRDVDRCLGEVVVDLCSTSEKPCSTPGCELKLGQHQRRFVHGGLRIVADVKSTNGKMKSSDEINLWVGCKICGATSPTLQMNDGT
jgi:1-phosphatidylinositol-3-phosphate 5-kinase